MVLKPFFYVVLKPDFSIGKVKAQAENHMKKHVFCTIPVAGDSPCQPSSSYPYYVEAFLKALSSPQGPYKTHESLKRSSRAL